jgi:hypothetical protein
MRSATPSSPRSAGTQPGPASCAHPFRVNRAAPLIGRAIQIVDPDNVSKAVLKERPGAKKAKFYCVRFFPTGDQCVPFSSTLRGWTDACRCLQRVGDAEGHLEAPAA